MPGDHDERRARPAHRELQPVGHGQRETRRDIARVETDEREAGATHEQIGGLERTIEAMAASHPEHARELDAGSGRADGVEHVIGIDERRERTSARDVTQACHEHAGPSRGRAPHEFRDSTGRDDF